MSVFQMLRDNLRMIFGMIPTIVEGKRSLFVLCLSFWANAHAHCSAKVSGDRVNDFLLKVRIPY